MISDLPDAEQAVVFRILPKGTAAETFEHLDIAAQTTLLKSLGREEVVHVLNTMSPDDRRITSYNVCYTKLLRIPQVLRKLWNAGQRTIPGGGAEILSDGVKKKISSKKGTSEDWLMVMREAHKIGFKSTATMT